MKSSYVAEWLRIALGFIFLWTFLDKTFGLNIPTKSAESWLSGGSPTAGFLKFGTQGPLVELFQNISGSPIVDWLFMLGMLGVGLALILGIGMKIAAYSGALMMLLIYISIFPPEHNLVIDEHIIYILALLSIKDVAGYKWSLRNWWSKQSLVKKYTLLN
jgi:thiosulfate dehydrogenase (quinone) large subunit